ADPERQRGHGSESDTGVLPQSSQRESHIGKQAFEQRQTALLSIALLNRFDAAELQDRRSSSRLRRHTGLKVVFGLHFDVRFEFLGQVPIAIASDQRTAQLVHHSSKRLHWVSPRKAENRAMM